MNNHCPHFHLCIIFGMNKNYAALRVSEFLFGTNSWGKGDSENCKRCRNSRALKFFIEMFLTHRLSFQAACPNRASQRRPSTTGASSTWRSTPCQRGARRTARRSGTRQGGSLCLCFLCFLTFVFFFRKLCRPSFLSSTMTCYTGWEFSLSNNEAGPLAAKEAKKVIQ